MVEEMSFVRTCQFELTFTVIDNLYKKFSDCCDNVKISATYSDGYERRFENFASYKEHEDSNELPLVTSITIAGSSNFPLSVKEERVSVRVQFQVLEKNNLEFSASAEGQVVRSLDDYLQQLLENNKPWYAWIASRDFKITFSLLFGYFIFGNLIHAFLFNKNELIRSLLSDRSLSPGIVVSSFFIGVMVNSLAGYANKFKEKFFPKAVFNFGAAQTKFTHYETYRKFVLPAAGSAILYLLQSPLTGI